MNILSLILVALCCYGIWEYRGHQKRLKRIPLRIHVNGTRGKSSVTRLIAAGLRAGGVKTLAKTTGTLPRIIDDEGKEIAIVRDQRANVIEQVKIVKFMDRYRPQAIVLECMAVLPEYQWFCEHQLVRSHVGVITNSRLDHLNEMGHFKEQITRSLGNTCPRNGVLLTSEIANLQILQEIASRRGTKVIQASGESVTRQEMMGFGHIEHPANVDIALEVCKLAGVDRQIALEGMHHSIPDAGALRVALCIEDPKQLLFINAMAANDPESTLEIVHRVREQFVPLETVIIMLNSRTDRQDRSVQLIEMVVANLEFDKIVLTGEDPHIFESLLVNSKIPHAKIVPIGWPSPEHVYQKLFDLVEGKGTILGIGNVGAGGLDVFRYFYKRRTFSVGVSCVLCGQRLMDDQHPIDRIPSIGLNVLVDNRLGWLRLSSLYGSYNLEHEYEIPTNAVAKMFCPFCHLELTSDKSCPECRSAMMVPMLLRGGGTAYICPRRGCKGHSMEEL